MLDASRFINEYISWLKENIIFQSVNDNIVSITSPFLDRNNDNIQIYIKKLDEDNYILTDDGYTISDLEMSGFSFNTPKRQNELNVLLKSFGISMRDDELTCEFNTSNFPFKKHSFIQGLLSINDLYVLSTPNIISFFTEDVEAYLLYNEIRFTRNIKFAGKSGFDHAYDFIISQSKMAPDRLVKVVNHLEKSITESTIFAWNDTVQARVGNTELFVFANDSQRGIPISNVNALKQYGIIPIAWSKKEQHLNALTA